MNHPFNLRILLPLLAWCCCDVHGIHAEPAQRPNFVLIFIDDMGYGDIEPFGSTLNETPNLNAMADQGMRLTSFYAAPVCSASRAQLLTGCYAPRVGVPGVFFPAGPQGLNPNERTVAEYLREVGYDTMCVGKWHLGDQPKFLPTNHGFDGYFGIPYSNDMQRESTATGKRVTPLLRDDQVDRLLEDEDQRLVTRQYTEEAVKFIQTKRDAPFFLYLPHTAMHVPLYPHQEFVGSSENGTYGDWVAEVDWSVGRILDTLRQQGLDKNTLVVFTSDNGPWASRGKDGGVSGPLRGSKGCTLEGGVREPTICWWPGKIDPGTSSDAIAGTTDVLPTLLSLAGGKPDPSVKIDGVDLSQLLLGGEAGPPRNEWYYFQGRHLKAVRSGPWKLAIKSQSIGMGMKERPADLNGSEPRLYNLDAEIGELTNVAESNPEVVARLQRLANEMIADIGSGSPGPGARPAGKVDHPVTLYPTKAKPKKRSTKKLDWGAIKSGDVFVSQEATNVARKPFSIRCRVVATDDRPLTGTIVAHGGSAVGYSLYARGGKIVFALRHSTQSIVRLSSEELPTGEIRVEASLRADGGARLAIAEGTTIAKESCQPLPRQPQEDLCIGHDNGNPVDAESPQQSDQIKIIDLSVTNP